MRPDRKQARVYEWVAFAAVGLFGLAVVLLPFAAFAEDITWHALGAATVCVCAGGPFYLAWLVWLVIRSTRRR